MGQVISRNEDDAAKTAQVLARLFEAWGREVHEGDDDVLAVLIRTILSQSTTKVNTDRAFASLLDTYAGDWARVAVSPLNELIDAIRVGGLARQKAPRIQAILHEVHEKYGEYSLEVLAQGEASAAEAVLLGFPGVGPKTALFVMMWAMGADVFPMDTHIFRILQRVGLLDAKTAASKAHVEMAALIAEGDAYPAHMAMVKHGREVCTAGNPRCQDCCLNEICTFYLEL